MGPDEAQMERFLTAVQSEEEKPVKKRVVRTGLVAALVCALLVGTAFAVSPTLRDMLDQLMGGFAPYSQEVENVSATDQGIEISVVRAIADEDQGMAYLAVKDTTGQDRVQSGTRLYGFDGYGHSASYDEETSTALVQLRLYKKVLYSADPDQPDEVYPISPYTLEFDTVYPTEQETVGLSIPWDKAAKGVLESEVLSDKVKETSGKTGNTVLITDGRVLKPEQTPMALEGTDRVRVSSLGWDESGNFHIQFALADGMYESSFNYEFTQAMADSGYYRGFAYPQQDYVLLDGKYIDLSFQRADQQTLADILPPVLLYSYYTAPPIEGDWTLTFPLETLEEQTVTMHESVGMPHLTLERMTFSILGIQYEGSTAPGTGGGIGGPNFPAYAYLRDGTAVAMDDSSSGRAGTLSTDTQPGTFRGRWEFPEPLEKMDVVGVSIGYWYIPIDGANGGPGHWLDKLPA